MATTVAALEAELPGREMTDLVAEILGASLRAAGLLTPGAQPAAHYERWLRSSIAFLDARCAGGEVRSLDDLWREWETRRESFAKNPNAQAQTALLEACLRALPAILTGRQRATDVMFPNSSMQLVEGVYRGNPQANFFNDALAATLRSCIEQLLEADPKRSIRILEIGAGTGGTTAALLPMLAAYPVDEYCYTDLSRAFLMHAEQQFAPRFPALRTAIFDVSKPLDAQQVEANRYDFVIAANVLHATPDIRETLRNAKALLRNQGVLLLNEIAAWSLFNHLTFGLLEGWWLYEDAALRLDGSPGLAPEMWRDILIEEGFESIVFPAEEAHRLGQQIVAAVSNGWTRQRIVRDVRPAVPVPSAPQVSATQANAPQGNVLAHAKRVITAKLSEALKMDAGMIREDASFADFGVDSIVGVNLVRNIAEALQIELETTSLFEYSTVEQLAGYVVKNWGPRIASQVAPVEAPKAAPVAAPQQTAHDPKRSPLARTRFDNVAAAPRNDAPAFEPIAIIGMSGRFAESESLDAFWQHLAGGTDLVREVTRWNPADCVVGDAGRGYCSHGSFVESIDRFDPAFFGISAVEAAYMDPQQRLFLEEAWHALEDAGYGGKNVHEKQCGVYVGCGSSNYDKLSPPDAPAQAFWGNSQAVTPTRIAYCLDLQGPAIAVDTACSSSLVAIHLACQSLWSRETEMALAGGVFLQPTPGFHQVANRAGMLSASGKCRSFDAGADGFVPGEGVGVVVLKRLRDAIADGDHVHGVIAGSGINQDGRSNGLIAPNGRAQERLARAVYDRFGIHPESIQLLEAHGTGTLLGDSIEYNAITRAFRHQTAKTQFCALGTVKTNIGHTSTAAGVAGVIKLLLALRHRQIPPSLHFETANPAIDLGSGPFYVNTELRPWPQPADAPRRRAAVSSFGFSGTNAHLVLEEAPAIERDAPERPAALIVLSARSAAQLAQQVRNLVAHLEGHPELALADISFTLLTGRTHLAHRLACVARDRAELLQQLGQWMASGAASQTVTGEVEEGALRERVSLKKLGRSCIEECRTPSDPEAYVENLIALGELFAQGYTLDFAPLFDGARRVPLPVYPFARERYWLDVETTSPRIAAAPRIATTGPMLPIAAPVVSQPVVSQPAVAARTLDGWLQDELSRIACGILGVSRVQPDQILVEAGFDSIGLTTFASAIAERFRLDVTPILFFDHPSLRAISKHLAGEYAAQLRPQQSGAASAEAPRVSVAEAPRVSVAATNHREPIAIVGMAGVMPGSNDLDALWQGLRDGRDLIDVIPADRWNWEDYYGDPLRETNKSPSKWGGFMNEVDKFDPLFFGISPREAQMMDPQQRIFLETVWKALEDAGQKPSALAGTRTGVFVGVGSNDYIDVLRSHPIALDGYTASGNAHSVLANRVSFLLDLRGPSAPIDTACSSSLVALHRAVESIRSGNCEMAIAGGVQVILSPGAYISFGKAGMLSPDGKCKTFDKSANGYVRGEGCGVVFLKPLSRALADGDTIHALIRATAENHGGRVTTMTAPNAAAQTALLIEAWEKAQVDPATAGFIECHGTGTSLGDPIEVQALTNAFAQLYKTHGHAPAAAPHCGLGSIKSNIGHLETAAGIAGVLKVVLALRHKEIPATMHFAELNPYINLSGSPFYVVDRRAPWQAPLAADGTPLPRRAGVSSFGFGGANAHAVLEEYVAPARAALPDGPQLVVLSAKNGQRLDAYVRSLRARLDRDDLTLADLAWTLQSGRDEMQERLAIVAASLAELRETLDAILSGALPENCRRRRAEADREPADVGRVTLPELAELWTAGAAVDWRLLHGAVTPRRISLPTYPFARDRYWIPVADAKFRPTAAEAPRTHERKTVLQTLAPSWHDATLERVAAPRRVSVIGDAAALAWARATIVEAEAAAELQSVDELLWIAPEAGSDLVAAQEEGVLSVFRTVKALLDAGCANRELRWTLITRRAQHVRDGEGIEPAHAGVAGLAGSIAKEHPRWKVRVLDIDSFEAVQADDCLTLPFETLAHRDGRWLAQRLDPVAVVPQEHAPIRKGGVYVVIGGARGIGEVWTRTMIEEHQAHVVWIGRREHDDSIERSMRALSGLGPAPLYIQADAADPVALAEARRTILRTYPAIHGVVHSAVVLHDRSLARMDEEGFRTALRAKVDVSVNIDRVFGADALDFVLFFSSLVSFVRPAGQSNYAAGCAFGDSFAQQLRQQRPYAVKVMNWGYWGEVGVAADDASRQRMARFGLASIEPAEGMAALDALMRSDLSQLAFVKTFEEAIVREVPQTASSSSSVRDAVIAALCEELRLEPAAIDADVPMGDYGVDSIVGLNLVTRISESLRVALEPSSLFEHDTVNRLAAHIATLGVPEEAPVAALTDDEIVAGVLWSDLQPGDYEAVTL